MTTIPWILNKTAYKTTKLGSQSKMLTLTYKVFIVARMASFPFRLYKSNQVLDDFSKFTFSIDRYYLLNKFSKLFFFSKVFLLLLPICVEKFKFIMAESGT